MLKISVMSVAILLAPTSSHAQAARGPGEAATETLEEFATTPAGQPVIRKRIVRTAPNGQKTETETFSAPLTDADSASHLPVSASLRTIVRNRDAELDVLEIVARAKTITETTTPDGTTRIIRITSEGRAEDMLITITKD